MRISARPEHADEALGRRVGRLAQLFEADRRLDVVAQDRLAGVDVATQHRVDPFAQQRLAERRIFRDVPLYQFLEASCQCHLALRFTAARAGGTGNPPTSRLWSAASCGSIPKNTCHGCSSPRRA